MFWPPMAHKRIFLLDVISHKAVVKSKWKGIKKSLMALVLRTFPLKLMYLIWPLLKRQSPVGLKTGHVGYRKPFHLLNELNISSICFDAWKNKIDKMCWFILSLRADIVTYCTDGGVIPFKNDFFRSWKKSHFMSDKWIFVFSSFTVSHENNFVMNVLPSPCLFTILFVDYKWKLLNDSVLYYSTAWSSLSMISPEGCLVNIV